MPGVCHILYHQPLKLRPSAHVAQDTSLPPLCCLSPTVTAASDMAVVGSHISWALTTSHSNTPITHRKCIGEKVDGEILTLLFIQGQNRAKKLNEGVKMLSNYLLGPTCIT